MSGTMLSILISLSLTLFAVALALIYLADEGVRRRLSVAAGGRRSADAPVSSQGLAWLIELGRDMQEKVGWKSAEDLGAIRSQLVRAGIYSERAVEVFAAIRILMALALSVMAGLILIVVGFDNALIGLLAVMFGAAVGLYAPVIFVEVRGRERTYAVRVALPDAMDLMVVSMEAGSTLTQAMQRVGNELKHAHPILSEQFQITLLEMQAGSSRAEALRRLSERAPDDRLRAFITLVIQSDQLGAGLGQTLRVFAEEMRRARLIEAEHKAAELPVKIAVPLVFFIFPCLMGVIFTPVIIRFIRILFQAGAGT